MRSPGIDPSELDPIHDFVRHRVPLEGSLGEIGLQDPWSDTEQGEHSEWEKEASGELGSEFTDGEVVLHIVHCEIPGTDTPTTEVCLFVVDVEPDGSWREDTFRNLWYEVLNGDQIQKPRIRDSRLSWAENRARRAEIMSSVVGEVVEFIEKL